MTTTYSFLHCGGCFADETGLVGSPLVFSGISGTSCLKAGCPSCHPLSSVKKLKETQSTDPAWPHLFFIHHRTPDSWCKWHCCLHAGCVTLIPVLSTATCGNRFWFCWLVGVSAGRSVSTRNSSSLYLNENTFYHSLFSCLRVEHFTSIVRELAS